MAKKSKKVNIQQKTVMSRFSGRLSHYLSVERVIVGGSLLATLVIVGFIALNDYLNRPIDIEGVERFVVMQQHSEAPVNYPQTPPAGGVHYPVWQNCGVYQQPVRNELAVHSLEHGAVWITYNPGLAASEVDMLRNLTQQSSHRLLSPYPGLPSAIVAAAWGYQLKLDRAEDPRLKQFLRQYEQGSTTPELGAVCSGGESRTLAEWSS
ncbi:MAG: DUF3105 domain-containing protein [Anaerolineae bacterium]|nr:DUF3105 domain-containing protein [Anaerolineae bacterium]